MSPFPKTREEMTAAGYWKSHDKICSACSAPLEMWRTPADKLMPMNAEGEFVTHFATCPESKRFKRERK